MLVEEIVQYKETWRDEVEKMQTMKAPIIMFGAGNTREFNLEYMRSLGIEPAAFCDNSRGKIGSKVGDLEILSFEAVKENYPDAYFYITTQLYYNELYQQILEGGYKAEQISDFDIIFQLQWEMDCMRYYEEHMQEIQELYDGLSDEKSKEVLRNRLLFLRTRERKYMLSCREQNQYFSGEVIDFQKVKCFVDLGVYTGDTVLQFVEETKGEYQEIYGFEPDEQLYRVAQENLKECRNVVLVKKATSDCDGEIEVAQSLGVMQTIESGVFEETEGEKTVFKVCKLDTFFDKRTTEQAMLKLDIEGAEMSALRGGENWIIKNKPIIAICVYHKQEDILEIPAYCKKLVPEYKMYLRHYSDNQTETVCYLVSGE